MERVRNAGVATLQPPGGGRSGSRASTGWQGGDLQVAYVCSDRMALQKPQSGPDHPSPGPLQSLPIWGGLFHKIPLGLGPNLLLLT